MSDTENQNEFEREAAEESAGFFAEWWSFLGHNKKWWLLPILVVLGGLGLLIILGGTAASPFIYTLF